MTYFSGLHHKPSRHADLKRIHRDSQETRPFRVENDIKTVNSGFFISSQCELNICIYTIILSKLFPRTLKLG